MRQPGDQVLIIEDCRDGGDATGQTAIYEGDFPRMVQVRANDAWRLFDHHEWTSGLIEFEDGTPCNQIIPEWKAGTPEPEGDYWFSTDNPRLRLADGTVIWGDECWWRNAEGARSLQAEQTDLEQHKAFLRVLLESAANEKEEQCE